MPSKLELVNRVLSELGKQPVEALQDSDSAIIVANKLQELYKEILLEANWTFAISYREDASPISTNYSHDYTYSFQLPGNFGRFYKFGNYGSSFPYYAFVDGMLLTHINPVRYWYIRNDVPFDVWPPLPARELVLYAAAKVSVALTQNVQLASYLNAEYEKAKIRAILENDMQRSVVTAPFNEFNRITLI